MQIRFNLPFDKVTGVVFKNSLSAVLSGLTIIGAFSTVILNSSIAKQKISGVSNSIGAIFESSFLYGGIKNLGITIKDWGIAAVRTKDDLKDWIYRYLGPDGFKSGVSNLYDKLKDWTLIVYHWFKDKFVQFIKNIPDMVENWKKLRFSLFKWGTFLGGGGGSAIWGILGSGNNWGKFGQLLGKPEFANLVDKFSNLLEKNSDAFSEMNEEEATEIFEKILEDPNEAEKIIDELSEERKEKNEQKKKELEEKGEKQEREEELEKDQILEKFKNSGGGSPNNPTEAFGYMVSKALKGLVDLPSVGLWNRDIAHEAKLKMQEYVDILEKDVLKKGRKFEEKQKFLDAIKENKQSFILSLAEAAKESYYSIPNKDKQKIDYSVLANKFGEILENKFTVEAGQEDGNETANIRDAIPDKPLK